MPPEPSEPSPAPASGPGGYLAGLPAAVQLHPGESVTLTLRAALGAGYGWTASSDSDAVEPAMRITPPAGEPGPEGAHGAPAADPGSGPRRVRPAAAATQELVLSGTRPGSAQISLRLARSWQPEKPLATHEITVRVTAG